MIRPLPWPGAAFTRAAEGDQRDRANREAVSSVLGISSEWATVKQVHGNRVVEVTGSGGVDQEADGLFTRVSGLPVAVLTADCAAVLIGGVGGVGVAHAGWRGMVAGVVGNLRAAMQAAGIALTWAVVGPFIGPCCFEVGPEVAARFAKRNTFSRQGRFFVDLGAAASEQLENLPIWWSERCTVHQADSFSYRRQRTSRRMAAVGWLAP